MKSAALITIAILLLAGCGGDDADEGPSTEEFIAQADAICKQAEKKQAALGASGANGVYGDNFSDAAFLVRHNAVTRHGLKRLRALDAPGEEQEAFGALLSAVKGTVVSIDTQIAALRAGDRPTQSKANKDFQKSYGDVVAAAGAAGLTQCQAMAN